MLFWTGSVLDRKKKRELRGAWKAKERLLGPGALQGDPKGWVRCEQALKRPVGRSFIAQGKGGARRKVASWQERVREVTPGCHLDLELALGCR